MADKTVDLSVICVRWVLIYFSLIEFIIKVYFIESVWYKFGDDCDNGSGKMFFFPRCKIGESISSKTEKLIAGESFECAWPFCGVGALRVNQSLHCSILSVHDWHKHKLLQRF